MRSNTAHDIRSTRTAPSTWLLRDPIDGGPLSPVDGGLRSARGPRRYPVHDGVRPIYDLFVPSPHRAGRHRSGAEWDPSKFDAHYEDVGYYEDGPEYEARQGLVPELTRFHQARVKDVLLSWLDPKPAERILDVGCGAGWFLERMNGRYRGAGHEVQLVGLEASRQQAAFTARRLARLGGADDMIVIANAERMPFADDSFDVVTCSETLEQVDNPILAVQEMARVLKPGGRLLLSAPSRLGEVMWDSLLAPAVRLAKAARVRPSEPSFGEYYAALYPEELESQVRAAGLQVHAFVQNGLIPHNHYFLQLPKPAVTPLVKLFDWLDHRFSHVVPELTAHILLWAEKPR